MQRCAPPTRTRIAGTNGLVNVKVPYPTLPNRRETRFSGALLQARSTTASAEFRQKLRAVEECLDKSVPASAVRDRLGCNATAIGSVTTALYAFLSRPESFEEALVFAVNLGGECDAIGAMTGAVAGAYHGAGAIPARWLETLERGRQAELEALADRLLERFGG